MTSNVFDKLSVLCAVLLMSSAALAVLPSDDFNDNTRAVFWNTSFTDSNNVWLEEINSRLELHSNQYSQQCYAFYISGTFGISTSADFSLKIRFHHSDTGLGASRVQMGVASDWSNFMDIGAGYDGFPLLYYEVVTNNQAAEFNAQLRNENDGSFYISYETATDTLYVSDTGYGPTNAIASFSGVLKGDWNAQSVMVFFGGAAEDCQITSGEGYLDDFLIESGTIEYSTIGEPDYIDYPESSDTGEFDVSWSQVPGAEYYVLNVSTDNKQSWQSVDSNYTSTTYPVLVAVDGEYWYQVRAGVGDTTYGATTGDHPCVVSLAEPVVFYVDSRASAGGNGRSWNGAFNTLQDAIAAAVEGCEIHIAQGTYKPDQGDGVTSDDRDAAFVLSINSIIKGGYAGIGHADPNKRDIKLYETILSGDLSGNDSNIVATYNNFRNDPTRSDNSRTVVVTNGSGPAEIDGLTITGGQTDSGASMDFGGGINCMGDTIIRNCNINRNFAEYGGGGISTYTNGTDVKVVNCTLTENQSYQGGGLYAFNGGVVTIINSIFTGSITEQDIYGWGAGIYCGGAMSLANCIVAGNLSYLGGGIFNSGTLSLNNCTVTNNAADSYNFGHGGGIYNDANLIVANSIVWGNRAEEDGGDIYIDWESVANVSYSNVGNWYAGNTSIVDWGPGVISEDPEFVDPNGPDGVIGTADDNLRLSPDSNCIDSGNNNLVPIDTIDLDGDGDTAELIPWDIDGRTRITDGDCNGTEIIDMGAYEFSRLYAGDFKPDGHIDFGDLVILIGQWLQTPGSPSADIAPCPEGDNFVDFKDFAAFAQNWLK